MPLYEYYCQHCDDVFEALRPVRESDLPGVCPRCGKEAERIMPTSFAARSFKAGYPQRVPYHHRPVYNRPPKFDRVIAPVRQPEAEEPQQGQGEEG
ncbi:MAG: zinc ribbon domain-containing protein [Dehalococcoidia bacterium]|jgi:putative FmdB family regulatory protein|nr:zinc ribbon domain-containing protein [Dehalococcoidia bacterium]MDW8009205.1 zinc ribbon domain-containing protein [Chloroflexota bacterium]